MPAPSPRSSSKASWSSSRPIRNLRAKRPSLHSPLLNALLLSFPQPPSAQLLNHKRRWQGSSCCRTTVASRALPKPRSPRSKRLSWTPLLALFPRTGLLASIQLPSPFVAVVAWPRAWHAGFQARPWLPLSTIIERRVCGNQTATLSARFWPSGAGDGRLLSVALPLGDLRRRRVACLADAALPSSKNSKFSAGRTVEHPTPQVPACRPRCL